jgi:DNA sulfur modification protein DndB
MEQGMIDLLQPVDSLRALARAKARRYVNRSVPASQLEDLLNAGWVVLRKGRTTIRLQREKIGVELLSDRMWSLLYRLGVRNLTAKSLDSSLSVEPAEFDVITVDTEVSIGISCISRAAFGSAPEFKPIVDRLTSAREQFAKSISKKLPADFKRNSVFCVLVENVDLQQGEREYAEQRGVVILDESDLDYYEKLADHLGYAAKYQLYAELLPGKAIPGLSIRVPAVRTRMGPQSCLTFPISPEYLLKIAYVSHRSKGKASDVHTYQRMLKKSRLRKIREYITDRGIFPTNIVLNIDKKFIKFEKVHQDTDRDSSDASGVLGWLTIKPAYKSAWVIDGQHRLFAYSGHEYARTGHLSVLAFEGISPGAQAQLFVDINAKQKSVKPSLLQELFAELHWDADSPSIRVQAIISKAVQTLDSDRDSPFMGRIQTADAAKDASRCISLASVFRALERHPFFIEREEQYEVVQPGPFWTGVSEKTLSRTTHILKKWFAVISSDAKGWWDLGSAPGGGLAMNDSVVANINILWSVLDHVGQKQAFPLAKLDLGRLWSLLQPYAEALGRHFGRMTTEERQKYRDLRGSQGQTVRTRRGQQAIKADIPDFSPAGLDEFLSREKAQTNLKGKEVIDRLEIIIQRIVIDELKQEFGDTESGWWTQGIPKRIRAEVVTRVEQDDNKRQTKEAYFDLIDYRTIVLGEWSLFQNLMGIGKKTDSKDRQTKWLSDLNEMRRIVAHSSSGVTLTVEQLDELLRFERELLLRRKSAATVEEDESRDEGADSE